MPPDVDDERVLEEVDVLAVDVDFAIGVAALAETVGNGSPRTMLGVVLGGVSNCAEGATDGAFAVVVDSLGFVVVE